MTFAVSVVQKKERSPAPLSSRGRAPSPVVRFASPKIQRAAACACGGGCPRCRTDHHTSRRPAATGDSVLAGVDHPPSAQPGASAPSSPAELVTGQPGDVYEAAARGFVQPKLSIGAVDDPLEHEADRVADQVMRKGSGPPSPFSSQGQALSRKCATCDEDEEKNTLQMKPAGAAATAAPPVVHEALRNRGQPLDHATRAFMEPRFGRDFSHVRLHTDALASRSAKAVAARAYTVGPNIVFRSGEYAPDSVAGRTLLAHELAHVVQQGGSQPATLRRVHVDAAGRKQFDSPDFAGDPKLEACLNDEDRLRPGARGESVAKVQRGLLRDGLDLGPTGADGVYGRLTEAAVREFKKKHTLGSQQFGDVGPGTMAQLDALGTSPTPTPPTPTPPAPTPPRVCGPSVDAEVTRAWTAGRAAFDAMPLIDKFNNCRMLVQPLILKDGKPALNQDAFDTWGLFQNSAGWTRVPPWHGPCGIPSSDADPENKDMCSNTVQLGGECWLSGTPNYGLFGIAMRACSDWTDTLGLLFPLLGPLGMTLSQFHALFSPASTAILVGAYKVAKGDNIVGPEKWALAAWTAGPSARPSGGNRPTCATSCPGPPPPPFFVVWEPNLPRPASVDPPYDGSP